MKLGNNSSIPVMGRGNIKLEVGGVIQVVTDVFNIPKLKNNLLSIGQLQEKGLAKLIKGGTFRIYHPRRGLIMQTQMSANRMFVVLVSVPQSPTYFQAVSEDTTNLWHQRFGHLSHKNLITLQYKKIVKGLPQLKTASKLCTNCMVGKQHRDAILKKSQWRARITKASIDTC